MTVTAKMCSISRASILLVFVCSQIVLAMGDFQQQRAKVLNANPQYVTSVSAFTTRRGRHSPYVTDCNITISSSWGNNVTIKTMFYKQKAKSEAFVLEVKTCDMLKLKWVRDWVEKYSNLSADTCPLKPGSYRLTGFEVPPKNFPFPMDSGDYKNLFSVYLTKTKVNILELVMDLKFETKLQQT